MIIAYMGFDMLRGGHMVGQAPPTDDDAAAPNPLAPLIMFAAGPGTITAIMTLAAVHTPEGLSVTAIVAAVVTYSVLLPVIGVGGGTQATVTRFMGLILASMGMRFVPTGVQEFLNL